MESESHQDWPEYKAILHYYGSARSIRSKVLKINHIDEGLVVLRYINAKEDALRAFCLHPIVQTDEDLTQALNITFSGKIQAQIWMLAMEYRAAANHCLPKSFAKGVMPRLSEFTEVNEMLIADKVQNRKDFERYHSKTHPNRENLEKYFKAWLTKLRVSESRYQEYCGVIDLE